MHIDELGLPKRVRGVLTRAGLTDVAEIERLNARELQGHRSVGAAAVAALEAALAVAGRSLSADPFGPYVCAREGKEVGDAALADLWLCDTCAEAFERGPFGGTPPEFTAGPMGGYCVNCNDPHDSVRLRQWLLCGVCSRVTRSFGKSIAATDRLLELWDADIRPTTGIELRDIDRPVLNRRDAETIAAKIASVDFVGVREGEDEPLFGFEMKTGPGGIGPGAVKPMAEFQLDCSDCDDMLTVAARDLMPVYLVHAQVATRAAPPTPRFVPVGFWWADMPDMEARFRRTQQRPRETRSAAYYDTAMFRPLAQFIDHVAERGVEELARRIERGGLPRIYV